MFAVIIQQSDLCGGEHRVLIQTEHSVGGDGVVGQKTAADHLVRNRHWVQKQEWTVSPCNH